MKKTILLFLSLILTGAAIWTALAFGFGSGPHSSITAASKPPAVAAPAREISATVQASPSPAKPTFFIPTAEAQLPPLPQAPFISETTLLHQPPSIFELELQLREGGQIKTVSLRGVALSREGKILTLAAPFDGKTTVTSASSAGVPALCRGWLARDASPWIILKATSPDPRPVQVVSARYLALKEGETLAIPTPSVETPNAAQTVLTTSGPDKLPLNPKDNLFWITGPASILHLGAAVIDRSGHLAGLIDEVRADQALARVRKVIAPLPVMDAAVEQEEPLDWTLTSVPPTSIYLQPFSDPAISQETQQQLASLSGAGLAHQLDDFLKQHSSPLAWSIASMGYARAGKTDYAVASAKMLTQASPRQWQAWYLYGRQLEASKQFSQAADAYQQALENGGPQHIVGIPLGASLFKSGNTRLGIESLKNLVNIDPSFFQAWLALGELQQAGYLLPDAIKSYTHLLTLNPQSVPNWEVLAGLYDQLKNPQGSMECYLQLTLLAPENPDIWYNLGLALLKAERPAAARSCFQKTIALRPDDAGAKGFLTRLDASPLFARQLLDKLKNDVAALPVGNLIDYSSIRNTPIDGKWEEGNLHLTFRHGNVHFRDRIDQAETSFPTQDSIPALPRDAAFLTLTVAPSRDPAILSTQQFDLGLYIPGFTLYVYYKDGTSAGTSHAPGALSRTERSLYQLIDGDLSQLSARVTSN